MRSRVALATICWMLASAPMLRAQEEKVINLENADHLEGKIIEGEQARELIGNVRFSQGKVRVQCDRALQYLASGKVFLTGHVVVTDDSVTMRAPRGVYYRDEKRAEGLDSVRLDDGKVQLTASYGEYLVELKRAFFRTRVRVEDSSSTVFADSLTYFRLEKRSVATGNVMVHNQTDHVFINGHHLEHFSEKQFTRVTEQPVLVKFDTTVTGTVDTLVVRSRIMESYRDSVKRLLAIDSVEIVRSNLAGASGFAEYFTQVDSIHLRNTPVLWYQETQVTGDSIDVALKARKLDRVHVMGHAFALSVSDSLWPGRYDQITGERMVMQFADQGLDNIDVRNRAISVYHLYEDTSANGLNKTSGDRIVMLFEKGKAKSIRVLGGVEGQYFPENMVQGKEMEYAIQGFALHLNRPRIKASDFAPRSTSFMQMNNRERRTPEQP